MSLRNALSLLTVVGTMFAACAAGAQDAKVQIWGPRDAQSSGVLIVASQKGFFAKNGVNAEVKFVSSGQEIPPGMAGGTIPIAIASWTNPMAMHANGIPVKVIAKMADISDALQVVVRSDAGIRMPKDLEGKKLGLTRISVLFSVLERGCATYGCDISKMTLVNMQPQEIVLAYERGNVDAVLTNEPWTTYVVQRGGKLLFTAAQSAVPGREGPNRIDGIYTAVFARPDFIAQNPKAAQGILNGLAQAAEWVKANPKEAAEIIGKEINIPTDAVVATLSRVDSKLEMTADWASEFDKKAEYLLGLKELRRKVVASDVFQPEPLRAVCGACASYK